MAPPIARRFTHWVTDAAGNPKPGEIGPDTTPTGRGAPIGDTAFRPAPDA